MQNNRALFIPLFVIGFSAQVFGQAVYDTLATKTTLYADMGFGALGLFGSGYGEYGGAGILTDLHAYQSGLSYQITAGYSYKLDRLQFDWRIAYARAAYTIDVESFSSIKGPSTSLRQTGSANFNWAYVQLLGMTFGKERSWGSWCNGPYIRYNFLVDQRVEGKNIREGSYWDGSVMTPVYIESAFSPPITVGGLTIGFQVGANFFLSQQRELHVRLEINSLGNELEGYRTFNGLISIGYVFTLKRDRFIMRRN